MRPMSVKRWTTCQLLKSEAKISQPPPGGCSAGLKSFHTLYDSRWIKLNNRVQIKFTVFKWRLLSYWVLLILLVNVCSLFCETSWLTADPNQDWVERRRGRDLNTAAASTNHHCALAPHDVTRRWRLDRGYIGFFFVQFVGSGNTTSIFFSFLFFFFKLSLLMTRCPNMRKGQ